VSRITSQDGPTTRYQDTAHPEWRFQWHGQHTVRVLANGLEVDAFTVGDPEQPSATDAEVRAAIAAWIADNQT
jgi:hypothetical protein